VVFRSHHQDRSLKRMVLDAWRYGFGFCIRLVYSVPSRVRFLSCQGGGAPGGSEESLARKIGLDAMSREETLVFDGSARFDSDSGVSQSLRPLGY
jgi:hypothetical protein